MKTHYGYKLTTQNLTTHNNTKWEIGKWKQANDSGRTPCSKDVLHYYPTKEVALFLNPIHANITSPRLFKVECSERIGTDGLKAWCKEQRLLEEISIQYPTANQRVAFAIFIAMTTASDSWKIWANRWLNGEDRSADAAAATAASYAAPAASYYAAATAAATAASYAAATAATAAYYAAAASDNPGEFILLVQDAAIKALSFK